MPKKTDRSDFKRLLSQILKVSSTGPSVMQTFRLMALAEEEIARGKRKHKNKKAELNESFKLLRTTGYFQDKADRVYRAHCRELVLRIVKGEDTRPGTAAEVLCGVLGASLVCPLDSLGYALAQRLFVVVMGPNSLPEDMIKFPSEAGLIKEAFQDAQRKLAQPWRQLTRY